MPLGVHLGREVCPLAVAALALLGQQGHRLHREGEQRLGAFLVEPFHETLLKPREAVPIGPAAVRKVEIAKQALKIVAVVIGDIPEYSLIVAGSGGLVEGVNNLFETIGNHLVDGALFHREVNHPVGVFPVVFSVFYSDKVVQVH